MDHNLSPKRRPRPVRPAPTTGTSGRTIAFLAGASVLVLVGIVIGRGTGEELPAGQASPAIREPADPAFDQPSGSSSARTVRGPGFQVTFPGLVDVVEQDQETGYGLARAKMWLHASPESLQMFGVTRYPLPDGAPVRENPTPLLKKICAAGVRAATGKVLSSRRLDVEPYAGYEVRSRMGGGPDSIHTTTRVYLARGFVYMLVHTTASPESVQGTRFLDSFVLS